MNIVADEDRLKQDPEGNLVIQRLKDMGLPDEAILYYRFPLYRGDLPSATVQAHILIISPQHGVVCLFCKGQHEYCLSKEERTLFDDVYIQIEQRLRDRWELRDGRKLMIPLYAYVVNSPNRTIDGIDYIDINELISLFEQLRTDNITEEQFKIVQGCIEGTGKITKKKERQENSNPKSKAAILNRIQSEEAVFDYNQKKVALQIIEGPQRIRGLAGSGKTIILAMKAALFHLHHPEADILYTYYTKSLHDTIKNLIERFYKDFSRNRLPDWEKIHILHGWGGKGVPGVYSTACENNGVVPLTFFTVKCLTKGDPFEYVCENLYSSYRLKPAYDLTLIDEGQDFPSSFYRLCYKLTKEKRIVWAYDDFQNIFDIDIQNEKETFGKDDRGSYLIDFTASATPNLYQDIVLEKCYRTPREVLTAAFSLGLGIYNSNNVLQRLEDNAHWESLGFHVEEGDSKEGSQMIISRPPENSPAVMNENFNEDSLTIKEFESWEQECHYVIERIVNDINNEGLRPDDICVICLKDRAMETYYNKISFELLLREINCFNLLNVPNNNVKFFKDQEVTLSTINKAKGNEAGMIYIMGVESVFINPNHVVARNRLFTAMTRAKGWVSLTGCGDLSHLRAEYDLLKKNGFKLCFTQPSKISTRTIENVSKSQQQALDKISETIKKLTESGLSLDMIMSMLGLNGQR